MKSIARQSRKWKVKVVEKRRAMENRMALYGFNDLDVKVECIQALILLGLKAVEEMLRSEVERLAGKRYEHGKVYHRLGTASWVSVFARSKSSATSAAHTEQGNQA